MRRALLFAAVLAMLLPAAAGAQTVTKVPSGDTIEVAGIGKVRLLGIKSVDEPALRIGHGSQPPTPPRHDESTPPPSAVGGAIQFKRNRPSRDYLRQLVLGKHVRLQYDSLAADAGNQGAYVFLADGRLVNAEMVRAGKARVDDSKPFAHQSEFLRLEQEAQTAGVGVWTVSPQD
jgi:micrococcal nuclease